MIKYKPDSVSVVFEEIPDKVTLAIEITNCLGECVGCHSPWLRDDIGDELTPDKLLQLIEKNKGINCVCFMGEGKDPDALKRLTLTIMVHHPELKIALYSGRSEVEESYDDFFDYIKVGPYIREFGPLNKETTNQRLYFINRDDVIRGGKPMRMDITSKFWRKDE